jgi:NitT/TauT family transport system substrate-binding protein
MRRGVHSLVPALVFAASLVSACRADREPPLRIGTVFWPSNELLFLAQDQGWLNPSEFRLVEFVDDGEVMRGFRNYAVEAAWLSMDEVLAVAQSGAVDPVILFLSDESRGGDAIVAQPDLITVTDLKDRRVAGADQLGQRIHSRSRAEASGAWREQRTTRQPAALPPSFGLSESRG